MQLQLLLQLQFTCFLSTSDSVSGKSFFTDAGEQLPRLVELASGVDVAVLALPTVEKRCKEIVLVFSENTDNG